MLRQNTIVQISSRPTTIHRTTHIPRWSTCNLENVFVWVHLKRKSDNRALTAAGRKGPAPRAVGKAVERQELLNWLIIWLGNIGRAGDAAAALIEAHTFCRTDERISYCCYFIQFMSIDKFINFLCCSKWAHPLERRKQILTQDRIG